jgi:hypothetical protein
MAISTILFISESFLRGNTPLTKNIAASDILNSAYEAQDMFISPILGSTFYDALMLSYSAQTLTADEITLISYVKPVVAYRAVELALPFITWNITSKGPQAQFGDNSEQIENNTFFYLKKEITNRAEWYETRLKQYLSKNTSLYSGYTSSTNNSTDVIPTHEATGYDSGFALYQDGRGYICNGFNGFNNIYQ